MFAVSEAGGDGSLDEGKRGRQRCDPNAIVLIGRRQRGSRSSFSLQALAVINNRTSESGGFQPENGRGLRNRFPFPYQLDYSSVLALATTTACFKQYLMHSWPYLSNRSPSSIVAKSIRRRSLSHLCKELISRSESMGLLHFFATGNSKVDLDLKTSKITYQIHP